MGPAVISVNVAIQETFYDALSIFFLLPTFIVRFLFSAVISLSLFVHNFLILLSESAWCLACCKFLTCDSEVIRTNSGSLQ